MALLIMVTKIAPGAGTLWPWDSCCGARWWAEEVKMVSSKPLRPHRSMLTRYAAACGQWLMFWYLQVNHRSAAAKTFQNCLTPCDRFHQRHNYEQIFHPALSDFGYHNHCLKLAKNASFHVCQKLTGQQENQLDNHWSQLCEYGVGEALQSKRSVSRFRFPRSAYQVWTCGDSESPGFTG